MFKGKSLQILFLTVALVMLLVVSAGCGQKAAEDPAANYPEKPIEFLCGWAPGGGSDQVARAFAPLVEQELGQAVTVVNKEGGSGATSYVELSKAKPDGYTIALATSTIMTHKLLGNLEVGPDDFEIVCGINYDPGGLSVKADAKWNNLEEFFAYCKENPGKVTLAASSPGSITRLQAEAIEQNVGIKFNMVPNPGGAGPGLVQLAGGHVDAAMGTPLESNALVNGGKIKMLGVLSDERVEACQDVPTFKEQGYDISLATSRVILAPKGTPKPIIDKLAQAFSKAVESEEVKTFVKNTGAGSMNLNPEQAREYLTEQTKMFEEIINAGK
ncbi:tripartite tricarboxylate transporter substrate binding protein [Candidatus Formimonas warabiya]|uniref:Tripartite tricarboxylate transporter substrate binding protein n=1 Tax=Formimonas warabiya TaxID=1761012 RepID=A0A3G1KZF4_FORW1|nr:tripartite tricarboxylate transporter substrate binding protein [Candidatus Formimonas warabiya]ATW27615.1 hypothetical protein DCMF_25225 [Candidatus Formimonas warabiya]